jgi:hypothetical protein
MTVLQNNPGVKCTLRATKGLFSGYALATSYGQRKFHASGVGPADSAIVSKPTRVLPI